MKKQFLTSVAVASGILLASSVALAANSTLTLRNDVAGNSSTPGLYGIMYEDINRCGDSGLYAQALRNWNFQANDTGGPANLEFWDLIGSSSSASIELDTSVGLNSINRNSLRLDIDSISSGRVGFSNEGWWGLRVQPNEVFKASFFAKATDGFSGPLNVTMETINGQVLASAAVDGLTNEFKKYTVQLTPSVTTTTVDNVFAVSIDSKEAEGKSVWFQVFSLFGNTYKNRENGLRPDIVETLGGLQPNFFRFPGGNNLEGQWRDARWKWNETIGPLEERKGRFGDWSYWNTNGQGLLDYMYLTEDMGLKPILDVYAGYSLDGSSVPEDELEPYIQEVLDELEYLMGDTSTTYGKLRAEHGREEPFDIPYIEIGNEDFFSTTYDYRYAAYYDAITSKYPNASIISTAGQTARPYDLIDDHFYVTTAEMIDMFNYYDNYARQGNGTGIFVGEFATNTKGCCGTSPASLEAALADGVFITGLERNSDFVKMIAYAPYMKRHGEQQWDPDMIHFDTEKVWVAPFYHIFQLYSSHPIDTILQVNAQDLDFGPLYWVAGSNKEKNQIYVKAVNVGSDSIDVTFNTKGARVQSKATAYIVSGQPDDENTIEAPDTIVPKNASFKTRNTGFDYTFEPYSATVLVLDLK